MSGISYPSNPLNHAGQWLSFWEGDPSFDSVIQSKGFGEVVEMLWKGLGM